MGHIGPLFRLFLVFSVKQFYNKSMWKISSAGVWTHKSQPSDFESPPLITRPGLRLSKLLKMGHIGPLFRLFSVFSIKHLQQINVKICIQYLALNSQPSDYESPPLTTRPRLPPVRMFCRLFLHTYLGIKDGCKKLFSQIKCRLVGRGTIVK